MTREWDWWTISSALYTAKDVPTKNGNELLHAHRAQWIPQILSVNDSKLKILTGEHGESGGKKKAMQDMIHKIDLIGLMSNSLDRGQLI